MEQARQFGASPQQLEAVRGFIEARNRPAAVGLWPEHWHAFEVFCAMETQWRVQLGMGGLLYLGLDYGALAPVLAERAPRLPRRLRQPLHRLMPQLRTLEIEAREHLNASKH